MCSLGDFILSLYGFLDFPGIVGKPTLGLTVSHADGLGCKRGLFNERLVQMVMLMKGVSGRYVMQRATGFRINHLEVRKSTFATKLGATEQAKFARNRMMSTAESTLLRFSPSVVSP